jgi:hypothetical protein
VVLEEADVLDLFGVIFVDECGWGADDVRKCGCEPDRFPVNVWELPEISASNLPILRVFGGILLHFAGN